MTAEGAAAAGCRPPASGGRPAAACWVPLMTMSSESPNMDSSKEMEASSKSWSSGWDVAVPPLGAGLALARGLLAWWRPVEVLGLEDRASKALLPCCR